MPVYGNAIVPTTEERFTIVPAPRVRIAGPTARVIRITPKTFVSNCRRRYSSDSSSIGARTSKPALLTSPRIVGHVDPDRMDQQALVDQRL